VSVSPSRGVGNGSLKTDAAGYRIAYRRARGKGAAELNHKPIKVMRLSASNPRLAGRTRGVRIISWLLAKDIEVRGKSLQLRKTYQDIQEEEKRREGNGKTTLANM